MTHFTDRGKIEKVSELTVFNGDNSNSLSSFISTDLSLPFKENNNNPFVGNTTNTNPFHTESNPFLNSFGDENNDNKENDLENGNFEMEGDRKDFKVCLLTWCMLHAFAFTDGFAWFFSFICRELNDVSNNLCVRVYFSLFIFFLNYLIVFIIQLGFRFRFIHVWIRI